MEIHSYEKIWLVAALFLIVGFIATVTYGAVGAGVVMVDDSGGTVNPDALDEDDRFDDPRVEQVGENEYEAYVIARQYIFQPNEIVVPANSEVTFYVTSPDVIHSFHIVGTNVNTMVIPGQVAELTAKFDEPDGDEDVYGIVCNEYCGPGHHHMEGTVVVVPEDEYEGDDQ